MLSRISPTSIAVVVAIATLFLVPTTMTSNPYYLRILTNICLYIIIVSGFRLVAASGQLTMAHAAFVGLGARTSALLVTRLGWNFWYCLPLAGMVPAIIAVGLGRITLRLKGIYFAIATFAFTLVIALVLKSWPSVFGVRNIPSPNPIGGWEFSSGASYYYLALVLMVVTLLVMYCLDKSRFGLVLRCIRGGDVLSASVGMNVMGYQIAAFAIGSFFAGIGGAFHVHWLRLMDAGMFSFTALLYIILYAVVGGTKSFMGPVYGCVIFLGFPVFLKYIPDYDPKIEPLIFGGILLLTVRFMPDGISGFIQRISKKIKGLHRKEIKEYAAT